MPRHITSIGELKVFLTGIPDGTDLPDIGVQGRALHHSQHLYHSIFLLVGMVLALADEDGIETSVNEADLPHGNRLWFWVNGQRFYLSYNRETLEIVLRLDNQQGDRLATFTDSMSKEDIVQEFVQEIRTNSRVALS